ERQWPSGRMPGLWQSRGMATPRRSATSISVSPANASTCSPFSLKAMISCARTASGAFIGLLIYLVRKVFDHAGDRVGRSLAEPADRGIDHRPRQLGETRLVPARRLHQRHRFLGADAARRALPARLVGEEFHHVLRSVARAVVLRQDDHR